MLILPTKGWAASDAAPSLRATLAQINLTKCCPTARDSACPDCICSAGRFDADDDAAHHSVQTQGESNRLGRPKLHDGVSENDVTV